MSRSDFVNQSSKIWVKPTENITRGIVKHPVVNMSRGKWNISVFSLCIVIFTLFGTLKAGTREGACSRSTLLQHGPATRLRSKAPSSAPTISSEKICRATKILLPSFAPSYQTGFIWGSKLQGQICCKILFQEQAPSCVLKFALRERIPGASSLVCTGWGTYPGVCFGSVFQEQAPSCVLKFALRERIPGASSLVCTGWGTYPGVCFGSVFQEQAPSCVPAGLKHRRRMGRRRRVKLL